MINFDFSLFLFSLQIFIDSAKKTWQQVSLEPFPSFCIIFNYSYNLYLNVEIPSKWNSFCVKNVIWLSFMYIDIWYRWRKDVINCVFISNLVCQYYEPCPVNLNLCVKLSIFMLIVFVYHPLAAFIINIIRLF